MSNYDIYLTHMIWKIEFTSKAGDQVTLLSEKAREALRLLVKDLQTNGPAPGEYSGPNRTLIPVSVEH